MYFYHDRNQELEIEVARLKTKMVDSDDPAHLEATRKEINKMMAELKRKCRFSSNHKVLLIKNSEPRNQTARRLQNQGKMA